MAQLEKLVASFLRCSGTFAWRDFVRMLNGLGYRPIKKGKTSGSRRKFHNPTTGRLIWADEPHNGIMGPAMVARLRKDLQERGEI